MDLIIRTNIAKYYINIDNDKKEISGFSRILGGYRPLDNTIFNILSMFIPSKNLEYLCESENNKLYKDKNTKISKQQSKNK